MRERAKEGDSSGLHLKTLPRKSSFFPEPDTPHQQRRRTRKGPSFSTSGEGERKREGHYPPLRGVLISKLALSGMETNVTKKERFIMSFIILFRYSFLCASKLVINPFDLFCIFVMSYSTEQSIV